MSKQKIRIRNQYEIELNMTCAHIDDLIIELINIQKEMRQNKERLFGYSVKGEDTETETLVIETVSKKRVTT